MRTSSPDPGRFMTHASFCNSCIFNLTSSLSLWPPSRYSACFIFCVKIIVHFSKHAPLTFELMLRAPAIPPLFFFFFKKSFSFCGDFQHRWRLNGAKSENIWQTVLERLLHKVIWILMLGLGCPGVTCPACDHLWSFWMTRRSFDAVLILLKKNIHQWPFFRPFLKLKIDHFKRWHRTRTLVVDYF